MIRIGESWRAKDRILLYQLARYTVAGAAIAGLQVLIYNLLVGPAAVAPQLANALASAIVLVVGYVVHSRFTFRGHGARDNLGRNGGRFVVAHAAGWLMNTGFVALLVDILGAPKWSPSLPMLTVTPMMLFCLKRYWVFR